MDKSLDSLCTVSTEVYPAVGVPRDEPVGVGVGTRSPRLVTSPQRPTWWIGDLNRGQGIRWVGVEDGTVLSNMLQ